MINEEVLEPIGEKRTLLNNVLRRKANWNDVFSLWDSTEGQMMEMKCVGRRRRTQLLDDLRNSSEYRKRKEEFEDKKR